MRVSAFGPVLSAALLCSLAGLSACSSDEDSSLDGSAADGSTLPADATSDVAAPDAALDAGVDSSIPDVPLTPCVSDEACRGGYVCLEGFCREACSETDPCRGELTTCDLQSGYCGVCASDADCTNGFQCDTGLCDGGCLTDAACGAGSFCESGSCRPQVCTPNASTCSDGQVQVCDARGSSATSSSCAGICEDTGAGCTCAGGECVARACVPGAGRCVASGGQVCIPDGSGYGALVQCGEDEYCVAGACLAEGCEEGSARCANSAVVVCNGSEFTVVEDCAESGSTCTSENGEASCQRTVSCEGLVASCSRRGSADLPSDVVQVVPLDTLDCQVTNRNDPDHSGTAYRWDVARRPDGSTTTFDSANTPESSFFVDIQGDYLLEVTAADEATGTICQASVQVTATYDEDISVQLTWDTPGDDDQTDEGLSSGTDLDLHYLNRSLGCWTQTLADCHWRNKTPDWPVFGNTSDDPSIDIDDVNGAGPENANHDNPQVATYSVGVNYYDAHGFGPSTATLGLFLFGGLVLSETRELTEGQFWHVADISWPDGNVRRVNEIYENISNASCTGP